MLHRLLVLTIAGLTFAASSAAAQSADRACAAMEAQAQRLNNSFSGARATEVVQAVRGIYTIHGLAFGGELTRDKCLGAIADMQVLEVELRGGTIQRRDPACIGADILQQDIVLEMEDRGMRDTSRFAAIYRAAGMYQPDDNPGGIDTARTCARAIGPLDAYLAELRGGGDQPDDYDLPAAYRVTDATNVNPSGQWQLTSGTAMTLWTHNGSQMMWEVGPGNDRRVSYWQPRAGLAGVGVRRGTLLFEGQRDGESMSGEARIFTPSCGTWVYPVSGPIGGDNASVTLYGQRPVVDSNCRVTDVANDELRFSYVADAPAGQDYQAVNENDPEMMDVPAIGLYVMPFRVNGISASETLNVRAGPSTANPVLFELAPNATDLWMIGEGCTPYVDQYAFSVGSYAERLALIGDKWCNVEWNGREGWVFGRYIAPM